MKIFNRKPKEEQVIAAPVPVETSFFTRAWVERQALMHNLVPSDDEEKITKILAALDRKNGQCPCGGNGIQYKCPCIKIRTQGVCTCGLFKSLPPRQVKAETTVKNIQRNA